MSKAMKVIEGEIADNGEPAVKAATKRNAPVATAEASPLIQMIERVLAKDPSIETIDRLLAMQQTVMAEQRKTRYLAAMAQLQAVLPAVERKGTAHNQKRYARYEDLIQAIRKPLTDNHFSLTFRIDQRDNLIEVTGVLGHEDGHQESTKLALPADNTGNKNPVQAWGSSISYAKRYVAMTLLGIATEDEDDDGKKAGEAQVEQITEQQAEALGELIKKTKEPAKIAKIYIEHFKVASLDQLSTAQLEKIKAHLRDKHGVE